MLWMVEELFGFNHVFLRDSGDLKKCLRSSPVELVVSSVCICKSSVERSPQEGDLLLSIVHHYSVLWIDNFHQICNRLFEDI